MSGLALSVTILLAGATLDGSGASPQLPVSNAMHSSNAKELPALPLPASLHDAPAPAALPAPTPPADPDSLVIRQIEPLVPPPVLAVDDGPIVVTAQPRVAGDPLQALNTMSFEATQAVDRAFVRPAAMTYRKVFPKPIRSGIRNFLSNLTEPVVFLNYLLQLKPGKAVETVGRFTINTTVGGAGLFDVAKRRPFKLPYRPNGFANTMGYYGVKTGPFLFLPLIGPTTVRDFIGLGLDRLVVPIAVGKPFNRPAYSIPTSILSALDQRNEFDKKLQKLHEEGGRPYAATREDYLQSRQAEIDALHGKRPSAEPRVSEPAVLNPE